MLNLTPHAIVVRTSAGDITYPPSGAIARAVSGPQVEMAPTPEGAPVVSAPSWSGCEGLPDGDQPILVSIIAAPAVVAAGYPGTVYVPDTGPQSAIRDSSGQIEAVRRLILWSHPRTCR